MLAIHYFDNKVVLLVLSNVTKMLIVFCKLEVGVDFMALQNLCKTKAALSPLY